MKKIFDKVYLALLLIFFYLPIAYTIIFSFNSSKSLTVFEGFSLRWYERMFESRTMMEAIWYTFIVAILSTILSTIIGTIASIGLSKSKKIIRLVMDQVNNIPVMMPEIVVAIGLLMLFSSFKIEKGFLTMLIAHVMFCTPYVMLSVMPKLRSLDPNLMEAALDLGATPWQSLIKVIVPQIMPGVVSGALIAFTMSIDDFVISYFVTGNGVSNISILVYSMAKRVNPSINAVSSLVILIITVALIIINVLPMMKKEHQKILRNVGLVGLAGGAAVAGCCAQMVGFAVMSFRENRWGGIVSQGIGTSMLQMGNIVKNPKIWIPPILTSAITGPLATCVFKLQMNGAAISSGMGTCGFVGQIGVYTGWINDIANGTKAAITAFDWLGMLLICFVLPAVLTWFFGLICRKIGWIKDNDLKLD